MKKAPWVPDLLHWYNHSKRPMPWRKNPNPYFIWLSEIMLQQTRVDAVIPYFLRFVNRFPTLEDLADSDLQEVLKLWEGLGYYSRARNIHKTAKIIQCELRGEFPTTYHDLRKLPGIGEYTAAALASIAFGKPVPSIDGNVLRVFTRFWGIKTDYKKSSVRKTIFNRLSQSIKSANPSEFNQSIMELGSLICCPKNPQCTLCPLRLQCKAYKLKLTGIIPKKTKKPPIPSFVIGVGVVWDRERFLIRKRENDQMLGGLWGFPGGKIGIGQDIEDMVLLKILEISSLHVKVLKAYCTVRHTYSHFRIQLTAYECEIADSGTIRSGEVLAKEKFAWITTKQIKLYPFDRATLKVMNFIPKIKNLEF